MRPHRSCAHFCSREGGFTGALQQIRLMTGAPAGQAKCGSARATVASLPDSPFSTEPPSLHAIAREVVDDLRLDYLCRCDIGIAAFGIAFLALRKPASVERAGQLRLDA